MIKTLEIDHLKSLLRYDANNGVLIWAKTLSNRAPEGSRAGSLNAHGYRSVTIGRRNIYAHRIAWALTFGTWPDGEIDHINGNKDDNRIVNLRDVSRSKNALNRAVYRNNISGFKGVSPHRNGRWKARIRRDGRVYNLGIFETPAAAHEAYCVASHLLHGIFANTGAIA